MYNEPTRRWHILARNKCAQTLSSAMANILFMNWKSFDEIHFNKSLHVIISHTAHSRLAQVETHIALCSNARVHVGWLARATFTSDAIFWQLTPLTATEMNDACMYPCPCPSKFDHTYTVQSYYMRSMHLVAESRWTHSRHFMRLYAIILVFCEWNAEGTIFTYCTHSLETMKNRFGSKWQTRSAMNSQYISQIQNNCAVFFLLCLLLCT